MNNRKIGIESMDQRLALLVEANKLKGVLGTVLEVDINSSSVEELMA